MAILRLPNTEPTDTTSAVIGRPLEFTMLARPRSCAVSGAWTAAFPGENRRTALDRPRLRTMAVRGVDATPGGGRKANSARSMPLMVDFYGGPGWASAGNNRENRGNSRFSGEAPANRPFGKRTPEANALYPLKRRPTVPVPPQVTATGMRRASRQRSAPCAG